MILDTEEKNSEKGEQDEKQPESPTSTSEKKKGAGKEDPPPEKNEKDPFNLNLNPLFPNYNPKWGSGGTSFPTMNYGFNPMMWYPYMNQMNQMGFPNYYNNFYGNFIFINKQNYIE